MRFLIVSPFFFILLTICKESQTVKPKASLLLIDTQRMIFMMENKIIDILNLSAWRMEAPQLFSGFHIIASLLAAALAVLGAIFFARRAVMEKNVRKTLVLSGWLLLILEVYKQYFLYYIVNGGAFDFWFFPFQLCSMPMYLCMLLPFLKDESRVTLMTFMGGYIFISATATLIYPEDILRPYISLTVHGFIWHGLLLFISLLIIFTGCTDAGPRGLRGSAVLFVIQCIIALNINIVAEPVMPAIRAAHPSVTHDWAAMFYLNPFHVSPQPVICAIQETAGIPAGLIVYVIAIAAVSSMVVVLSKKIFRESVLDNTDDDL
jgi:uncharacterized membrane protein YwaF